MWRGLWVALLFFVACSHQREWKVIIETIEPFPVLDILANDTIRWINNDDIAHTVNSTLFESGIILPGEEFVLTNGFNEIGRIDYHCDFHPSVMTGIIHVLPNFDPTVEFSSIPDVSPLPGFSVSIIEGVSTIFSETPGIFGFRDGFSPTVRAVSPNYFLSPDELPDAASTLAPGGTFLLLLFSFLVVIYL